MLDELRDTAARLVAIADALGEQEAAASNPSDLLPVDREISRLIPLAEAEVRRRRVRYNFLPAEILGEPCWDMLLDIFIQHGNGRRISLTSVAQSANCPVTTALRWLVILENRGLARRVRAAHDRRVQFVEPTEAAVRAIVACFV